MLMALLSEKGRLWFFIKMQKSYSNEKKEAN
jgi:hypothetical protein